MLRRVFANNMQRRRRQLNISRVKLGQICNVGRSTIGYIETGRENKDNPTLDTVETISKGLKLPPWYMLFPEADFNPDQADSIKRFVGMYYSLNIENRRKVLEYVCDLSELQNKK